jgi:hypothetical protein
LWFGGRIHGLQLKLGHRALRQPASAARVSPQMPIRYVGPGIHLPTALSLEL